MKVAIMGAGSLGTIVGALLTKNGCAVDLIDANVAHVKALNMHGAKIIGLHLIQPVKALTPDEMKDQYDIILYLVKNTQNEAALPYVAKYLKPSGVVVVGQNGLPEEAVSAVVGKDRVIGHVTDWGATWVEPGVSKLTSDPAKMTFHLGELDGRVTERLKMVAEVLSNYGKPDIVDNLTGIRWTKLTANCCFSGMSAVVAGTFGDVIDTPKAIRCAAHILNESMAIAKAAGVKPELFMDEDLTKMTFKTEKELEAQLSNIKEIAKYHRNTRTGMLYDIEAGRYPEIVTTFNGVLCRWGEKHGIPTPVNQQVVDIVHAMATGKLKIDPANVDRIDLPKLP